MARYPQAVWRPLAKNWAAQRRLTRHDLCVLHTMAGSLAGTESWFNRDGYAGVESHFGVGGDGTVWQWQDTDYQADANGSANARAISIETEDRGPYFPRWNLNDASEIPPWTPAQIEAIAKILAWSFRVHGVPLGLIPDTKPARRGVGYHRQGAPGFMVAGGERWTSVTRKPCPGDRRIAQIGTVIGRAQALADGAVSAPIPTPSGRPVLREGATGETVRSLQRWLNVTFPAYSRIDLGPGRYGPQTIAVVKEWQGRSGLVSDGVFGPRSWEAASSQGFRQ